MIGYISKRQKTEKPQSETEFLAEMLKISLREFIDSYEPKWAFGLRFQEIALPKMRGTKQPLKSDLIFLEDLQKAGFFVEIKIRETHGWDDGYLAYLRIYKTESDMQLDAGKDMFRGINQWSDGFTDDDDDIDEDEDAI